MTTIPTTRTSAGDVPFADRHRALLDCLASDAHPATIAAWKHLTLSGNEPSWIDSGIDVAAGDAVTTLADGRIYLSEALGLWGRPRFHLWARIGEHGTIWNGTRDTYTRPVDDPGRLFFAIYQGEWATRTGELATPLELYAAGGGALDVVLIQWRNAARAGLETLARLVPDDELVRAELARVRAPTSPPAGWRHLW